jgi:serine/threonine protein kinase
VHPAAARRAWRSLERGIRLFVRVFIPTGSVRARVRADVSSHSLRYAKPVAMTAARVSPGDVLAGKYRVESVLGEGGMGVVVAAHHLALDQRVAVKFLRKDMADRGDAAERFRREARAVAKIKSEHVARVLDVGTMEDGATYIVMEYLDGNDLAAEMQKRGAIPIDEAVDIALQIADAVSDAHDAGIVHRDLKPANVFLVRRSDGARLAKVLDFGISKSLLVDSASNVSLTQTSTVMGSPLYMSPEQMRSARDVDGRTDIWALGVILYEALAGAPPHGGASLPEICTSLLHDTPAPLESSRSDLPPGLSDIVMRCLAKDRSERWSSMREVLAALLPYAPQGTTTTKVSGLPVYRSRTTGSGISRPITSGTRKIAEPQPVSPLTLQSTEAPASLTLTSGESREARRARVAIWVGLFGAAILVSVIAVFVVRFTTGGGGAAKGPEGTPADPPKAAGAGVGPVVAPQAAAAEPPHEPSTITSAAAVTAAGSVREATSAAPEAPSAARPNAPRAPRTNVPKRPQAQTETITDFGGRR